MCYIGRCEPHTEIFINRRTEPREVQSYDQWFEIIPYRSAEGNSGESYCKCKSTGIIHGKRGKIKPKKRMPRKLVKNAGVTVEEEMRRSMLECIDQFRQELNARSEATNNVLSTFTVIQPRNLLSANEQQFQESILSMTKIFFVEIMRRLRSKTHN